MQFRALILVLMLGSISPCVFGESFEQSDSGQIQLRIYQEYEKKEIIYGSGIIEDVLVFKKEWIGHKGTLAEKITANAIYSREVGDIVTYNLYFGEKYLASCEIPYGDGEECYIEINLPSGATLEGRTYQIVGGYGIEDFNIHILEPGEPVPLVIVTDDMITPNETVEEKLNETEEITLLCEEISCPDYCSGNTLYSSGKCNEKTGKCEYSRTECENGCDAESAKCIQVLGDVVLSVFINEYGLGAVGSGWDSVNVKASIKKFGQDSVDLIEGAKVIFEVGPPEGSNVFGKYGGTMEIEATTDSNGEAVADIPVPEIGEFYPGLDRDTYDTYITIMVKASKHSDGLDFDYEDGPYTIEVASPVISIKEISISPNPAKAHETHDVVIKTSDKYVGGPAQYTVTATEGVLSFGNTRGGPGGGIGFDKSGTEVHVTWEAPKRGLTPYEFSYAKELVGVGTEYGIGVGSSIAGVAFPLIKSGETAYGMYGDAKNIIGEAGEYGESLSAREKAYRAFDIGLSNVKLGVGAISLTTGTFPGGGLAKELVWDQVILIAETGQAKLKQEAAEARWEETETRKIDQMIKVEVVDSEGYSDTDFLIYEMEYLWEKGEAEGSGGDSW